MLRQRLGAQARQLAEQHFGQDAVLRRLELELAALVANRGVWRTRRGVPRGKGKTGGRRPWLPKAG